MTEDLIRIVAIGVGATLAMDLWGWVQRRAFGARTLDYGRVGRWLLDPRRKPAEAPPPSRRERALGWIAHYACGVAFAALLVAVAGRAWLKAPTLGAALLAGVLTLAAPFLILQPALGAGLASSRTPDATAARLRSLLTHLVFGAGLYAAAAALAAVG